MAAGTGKPGGSPKAKQPAGNVLERILRSNTSAELVGAMVYNGINIPEDDYHGAPIRLQLSRIITMPLDNESRNIIATFVLHWADPTNPTKVRAEAGNAATVKPFAVGLIDALVTTHTHNTQRASVAAKRERASRTLDELIGKAPGRPSDDSSILSTVVSSASGGGNDIVGALLVLNEVSENIPMPIRLGPRRSQPIEERREWAAKAAKKTLQGIAVIAAVIGIGLGLLANWAIALIAVLAFFAAIVLLVRLLIGKTGQLFKRLFPQLDEDGFRQKALRQCETTRSYIGLSKQEIVDFDLDHKFLEEVDGELRKEGIVYNRYDEQIDDWVRDYLGLATARPTTPKVGQLERFFKFLHRHGW